MSEEKGNKAELDDQKIARKCGERSGGSRIGIRHWESCEELSATAQLHVEIILGVISYTAPVPNERSNVHHWICDQRGCGDLQNEQQHEPSRFPEVKIGVRGQYEPCQTQ